MTISPRHQLSVSDQSSFILLQIALGEIPATEIVLDSCSCARHDLRLGRDVRHGLRIVSAFQELADAEGVLCG